MLHFLSLRVIEAANTIVRALDEVISIIGGMGLLIDIPQFVLKYIIFGKYGDAAPKVRGTFASYSPILPLPIDLGCLNLTSIAFSPGFLCGKARQFYA